jgi:quercetin dioxygenase-like cupin family protein
MVAVRRVVTGHDANGRAVVIHDDIRGEADRWNTLVWATDSCPANNNASDDAATRPVGTTSPGGSLCRYTEVPPGHKSIMHRTGTIDFGIVIEGEIEMELDGGEWVTLRAGDVIVQRGTNHAWENKSGKPCRMWFAMIEADPVVVNGTELEKTLV